MLKEVELLVAGALDEIRAVVFLALGFDVTVLADDLVALLSSERRIRQDDIVA